MSSEGKSWADVADEEEEQIRAAAVAKAKAKAEAKAESGKVSSSGADDASKSNKESGDAHVNALADIAKEKLDIANEEAGGDLDDEPLPEPSQTGLDPEAANDNILVQQADPTSPLHSVKSFEEIGLSPEILKGVYGMKFVKPSKIQEVSLPMILKTPRTDLVGQAQSGTGKTACFVLGMLSTVDVSVASPQCLCLCPTRELARQVMSVLREMSKFTAITSLLVLKEDRLPRGQRINAQVIIGTSGSVLGYIQKRVLNISSMRMFVLDEADEMIKLQGQGDSTMRIRKLLPKTCQTLLFSATFPPAVEKLVSRIARSPNSIRVEREKLTVDGIKQLYVECESSDKKFDYLSDLYAMLTIGQSVVFVQQRATGDDVARRMTAEGHAVSLLHSGLMPNERDDVIDRFRSGKSKVLITTNVLSRGIDIRGVTLVINYDIPIDGNSRPDPEAYLHRIGRSGRFGRKGVAVNLVHDAKSKADLDAILKVYNKTIEKLDVGDDEKLEKYIKEVM